MGAAFTKRLHNVLQDTDDIGLNEYPIFDESYRAVLNNKIIDHYRYYEIGAETVEMFAHFMRMRMNEIMPYFNKLYVSEQLEFDPLSNYDLRTISDGTNQSNSETIDNSNTNIESTDDTKSRTVASETPQNLLAGNGDYATSAADSVGQSMSTNATTTAAESQGNATATSHGESRVTGYSGLSGAGLLMEYRQALLNIDVMVIDSLQDLFMQVWNTTESYFGRELFPW